MSLRSSSIATHSSLLLVPLLALALLSASMELHASIHEPGTGMKASERFAAATHAEEPIHLEAAGSASLSECVACLVSKTTRDFGAARNALPALLPKGTMQATALHRQGVAERSPRASRAPPLS